VQASLQQWLGDVIRVRSLEVTSVDSSLRVDLSYIVLRTAEDRAEVFLLGGTAT
jgi:hypothetical protein